MSKNLIIQPMGQVTQRLIVETDNKGQARIRMQKTGPVGQLIDCPVSETELLIVLLNLCGSTVNGMHMRAMQQMGLIRNSGGAPNGEKTTD